jgi:septum formation inhibitor-activating ATPase MinD
VKELLNADEVKTFLKKEIFTLPYAPDDAVLTSNGGKILSVEKPSSPLTVGLMNLQKAILGEKVELEEGGIFSKLKSILGL